MSIWGKKLSEKIIDYVWIRKPIVRPKSIILLIIEFILKLNKFLKLFCIMELYTHNFKNI